MSFSYQVKEELLAIENSESCCAHAQAYGLAMFGRAFSLSALSLQTEHEAIARRYQADLRRVSGVTPTLTVSQAGKYIVMVRTQAQRRQVLAAFGHGEGELALRLNRANLANDCCYAAFLRGAFLACGTLTAPEKDYHFEFAVPHRRVSLDLMKLLEEQELQPKLVERKGSRVVYFKESESIEDVLTLMGAVNASLELMGVKMYKDMRNNVNRKLNFETANITRTVDAAMEQVAAIERIAAARGLDSLPPQLRELAALRRENPDMSLRELGWQLSEPISRSGVNHRLQRILEIARELPPDTSNH